MYYNNTLQRLEKAGLILSLILGFIALTHTTAAAQYPTYRDNRNDGYYNNNNRYDALNVARQNGYRDGFNDGADAAREGDRFHPQNSGDWQKGTNGYDDRYGNKNVFKRTYRDAYMQGYRAGYDQVRSRRGGYNNRRNY